MIHRHRLTPTLLASLALLLAACSTTAPQGPATGGNPDAEAASLQRAWEAAPTYARYRGHDDTSRPGADGGRSKELIRRQAENLVFQHPDHVPTRMVAGVTAYEARDRMSATVHLDSVLDKQPVHPEAAILRARIALEDGNLPYAIDLLEGQVRLTPDHAGLHETLASAYHLAGDAPGAMAALDRAEALGAPRFRVAYNRGLVAETQGDIEAARTHYREAVGLVPHWPTAASRLRAIEIDTGEITRARACGVEDAGSEGGAR